MAGRSDSPADNVAKVMSVTKEDLSRVAGGITLDTVYFMEPTMSGGEGDDDE